jgi:hypothetical protein
MIYARYVHVTRHVTHIMSACHYSVHGLQPVMKTNSIGEFLHITERCAEKLCFMCVCVLCVSHSRKGWSGDLSLLTYMQHVAPAWQYNTAI